MTPAKHYFIVFFKDGVAEWDSTLEAAAKRITSDTICIQECEDQYHWDQSEAACVIWWDLYSRDEKRVGIGADGCATCPEIIKNYLPGAIAELEGSHADWQAETAAMNRDYHNSLGVGSAWR
jgi:hypothetical protein